jgi:hypothetical protein
MRQIIFTLCCFIAFINSANAGEIYNCIDRDGNTVVTDSPQDGMAKCVLKVSYETSSQPSPTHSSAHNDSVGYIDAPVVFGRPLYDAPPVTVTYSYDYYTYQRVGTYVDIVFWRNGHSYRNEHWYVNGKRVSSVNIRSNPFQSRNNSSEFAGQREKLIQHHNISNPDSNNGSSSISKQKIVRHPLNIPQSPQLVQSSPQQTKQKSQEGRSNTKQTKKNQVPPQIKSQ